MGATPVNQPQIQPQPQPQVQMTEPSIKGQDAAEASEGVKKAGRSKRRYNNRRRSKESGGEGNNQSDGSTGASGQDIKTVIPSKTEIGMNPPAPVASPQNTNANSEGSKKKPPRKGWWQKLLK